jgi:hypothetical protein
MNAHVLYDLVQADHRRLVELTAWLRQHRPARGRRRWWHALWRPPHAYQRPFVATPPAPLQVR